MAYEGSAGQISHHYDFGTSAEDPNLKAFGNGSETDVAVTQVQDGINNVRLLGTGSPSGNSVGRAWPAGYRPGITEDGVLRPANGSLVTKVRFGFPAITSRRFFFGVVAGEPGDSYDVDDVLTMTAAGVITKVESQFAGFLYNASLTSSPTKWRTVFTDADDTDDLDVITPYDVKGAARYMNVSPELSPTLEVAVVFDGTVEFSYNGKLIRKIPKAISPNVLYAPVFVLQTTATGARTMGVDYFCDEYGRYVGPVFPS